MLEPFFQTRNLAFDRRLPFSLVTKYAMILQCMSCVEHRFNSVRAVFFVALANEVACECKVVENTSGICPLLEQVVVLKEVVVAEGCVSDNERLHHHGV